MPLLKRIANVIFKSSPQSTHFQSLTWRIPWSLRSEVRCQKYSFSLLNSFSPRISHVLLFTRENKAVKLQQTKGQLWCHWCSKEQAPVVIWERTCFSVACAVVSSQVSLNPCFLYSGWTPETSEPVGEFGASPTSSSSASSPSTTQSNPVSIKEPPATASSLSLTLLVTLVFFYFLFFFPLFSETESHVPPS